jgi:hypothetical protein
VTCTYVVTNTGTLDIFEFSVSDSDPSVMVDCPLDTYLPAGSSATCTATGSARVGQYQNTATVDAVDILELPLTDSDPSHYFGAAPAIDVEKATNGPGGAPQDADTPTGPRIPVGDRVTWTYVVTNTGNVALAQVQLNDDKLGFIPCPETALAVGASMTCTATGTAQAGQYANLATATGQVPLGLVPTPVLAQLGRVLAFADAITVTDTDPSHYFGVGPAIEIEKSPDDGSVPAGDPWTFTIEVTNNGEVDLVDVEVSDPKVPACDRTIGSLAVGQTVSYDCDLSAVDEAITNVAFVEGRTSAGLTVTDEDDARVRPVDVTGPTEGGTTEKLTDTGAGRLWLLLVSGLGLILVGGWFQRASNHRS